MSETVEEMLKELKDLEREELTLHKKREDIIQRIASAGKEDWDWISVKVASELLGRSVSFIYTRISSGSLETRHHGSCVMVKKSQVMAMDDRYVG